MVEISRQLMLDAEAREEAAAALYPQDPLAEEDLKGARSELVHARRAFDTAKDAANKALNALLAAKTAGRRVRPVKPAKLQK